MKFLTHLATSPEFEEVRNLAKLAVNAVFRSNAEKLVFGGDTKVEIGIFCNQIRTLLAEKGIRDIPQSDSELYIQIIQPLFVLQSKRSL